MEHITDEAIKKYLDGRDDDAVKDELRKWFVENDVPGAAMDNVEKRINSLWDSLKRDTRLPTKIVDEAFAALMQKISGRKHTKRPIWRIASQIASVLFIPLLAASAYLLFSQSKPESISWAEVYVSRGETRQIVLADGSTVWLNAGSYLFYPDSFDTKRQIFISGEAFIDVAKDEKRPFSIEMRHVNITVLGTKFNVRSYSEDRYIETSLLEGAVSLSFDNGAKGGQMLISPGDKVLIDNETGEIIREKFDVDNYASWKDGYYSFRHKTLGEITKDLERIFDVQIVIRDSSLLNNQYFASIARGWGLEQILDALNMDQALDIERDNRIVEIKYK